MECEGFRILSFCLYNNKRVGGGIKTFECVGSGQNPGLCLLYKTLGSASDKPYVFVREECFLVDERDPLEDHCPAPSDSIKVVNDKILADWSESIQS